MVAFTPRSVLVAPHHHGLSQSLLDYNDVHKFKRNPGCELVLFSQKNKRSLYPKITYCQRRLAQKPLAAGHFQTAVKDENEEKMLTAMRGQSTKGKQNREASSQVIL